MAQAGWTYEVPFAGEGAVGLEDYAVEASDGKLAGKVLAVLMHEDTVLLAVERGTPPVKRERRAVPWQAVSAVDHAGLVVRLALASAELSDALELEPEKAVEGGPAEAVRVTDVPGGPIGVTSPDAPGPVDRPSYATALILLLLGAFSALIVVALLTATGDLWPLTLVVLPVALFSAAGVFAYRFFFGRQAERV
jgi:hypothetical protein